MGLTPRVSDSVGLGCDPKIRRPKAKHESAMNTHFICLKPQDVQIYVRTEVDPLPL